MKLRRLRIACSVACGLICLTVAVFWVRSYRIWDEVGGEALDNTWIQVRSLHGQFTVAGGYDARSPLIPFHWSSHRNYRLTNQWVSVDEGKATHSTNLEPTDFGFTAGNSWGQVRTPHWFSTLLFLILAAISWPLPWQFSLRTLLIAMTAAAIGVTWVVQMLRD
jgi:hypothetical protein